MCYKSFRHRFFSFIVYQEKLDSLFNLINQKNFDFYISPVHVHGPSGSIIKSHYHVLISSDCPLFFNYVFDLLVSFNLCASSLIPVSSYSEFKNYICRV